MKNIKILVSFLLLLCTIAAQGKMIDVTSTYLTNANFASGTPIDNHICTYGKDMAGNSTTYYGMQSVTGWTSVPAGTTDSGYANCGIAAGLYAYGGTPFLGGSGYTAPASGPGGTSGNAVGLESVWNTQVQYTQDVTLPAGNYTVTFHYYNKTSGTTAVTNNLFGFIADGGSSYYCTPTAFTTLDTWTTMSVSFTLASSTSGKISMGYRGPAGNASMPHLFIDKVVLTQETSVVYASNISAPTIGVDPSTLSSSDIVYIYNTDADAFISYGMNWNTNAIATRLSSGDQAASTRNQCYVIDNGDDTYTLKSEGNTGSSIFSNGGTNDVWIDNTTNNVWTFSDAGNGTYRIIHSLNSNMLDVSWEHGGHLTTMGGQGMTRWAFIPAASITNGTYALYKAKKLLFNLYNDLCAAGVSESLSAMTTAATAYNNGSATVSSLTSAAQTLFRAQGSNLSATNATDVSFLFTNADMLGKQSVSSWSSTSFTYANADIEWYHNTFTLNQRVSDLPVGMYTVRFRNLVRNDGSNALPNLTATGAATVTSPLLDMTTLDWGCNTNGDNNWSTKNNVVVPNGTLSAGQALTHTKAESVAEFTPIDTKNASTYLTVNVNQTSTTQWVNFQGMAIEYTTVAKYLAIMRERIETAQSDYSGTICPGISSALTTALTNIATNPTTPSTAYNYCKDVSGLIEEIPSAWPAYQELRDFLTTANGYTGTNKATALDPYISSATTTANNATTATDLRTAYETLHAAYWNAIRSQTTDGSDMTLLITNPGLNNDNAANLPTGWTGSTSSWRWTMGTGDTQMEAWNGTASDLKFDMYQDITELHEGVYEIGVSMYNSTNSESGASLCGGECGLYASTPSANAYTGIMTDGSSLNPYSVFIYVNEGETLRIGVKNVNRATARWFSCDDFTLTYRTLAAARSELISSIPDKQANSDLTSTMNAARTTLNSSNTAANFNALTTAIAHVLVSATAYAHVKYELDNPHPRRTYATTGAQTEYASVRTRYQDRYDDGSISGNGEKEVGILRTALPQAILNTGGDLTVLIENNSFETGNTTGWSVGSSSDTGVKLNSNATYTTTGTDGNYLFNTYWQGLPITQNIGYLPAGEYKLTALVTSDANKTYLIVNGTPNSGSTNTDKTTWNSAKAIFALSEPTQVTIGAVGSADGGAYTAEGWQWYKADNFRLSTVTKEDIADESVSVTARDYLAVGSEDIFGRITSVTTGDAVTVAQGFCCSTDSYEPTIFDITSSSTLSYEGTIYKISGLTPQTAYYVRPYVKLSDDVVVYGNTKKVYTLPRGTITYNIRDGGEPDVKARITEAVRATVEDYWNRYTCISGFNLNVGYVYGCGSGGGTAECSYGGYMSISQNVPYQAIGTVMHEGMHGIGVGTQVKWWAESDPSLRPSGTWLGPRVLDFIKFWDNNDGASFYGDNVHGWGSNVNGSLSYTINGAHEDAHSDLQYTANSLLCQALGEDGLTPTSGGQYIQPHYAFEQDDNKLYYIRNRSTGTYLIDGGSSVGMSASISDAAKWRITYNPSTRYYAVNNYGSGDPLRHYGWAWYVNTDREEDKRIQIVKSHQTGYYWIVILDTNQNTVLDGSAAGYKSVLDLSVAGTASQDWEIIEVPNTISTETINGQSTSYSYAYTPVSGVYNIEVNRKFNAGAYNSLVLPFSISGNLTHDVYGAETVYYYTGTSTDGEGLSTLHFEGRTTGITANTPVFIWQRGVAGNTVDVSHTFIEKSIVTGSGLTVEDPEGVYDYIGTYATTKIPANGVYVTGNNLLKTSLGNTGLQPTRAYFADRTGGLAKLMGFTFDDDTTTTGIMAIEEDGSMHSVSGDIYSLDGKLIRKNATSLNGLKKGLYIMNGKKYLIK